MLLDFKEDEVFVKKYFDILKYRLSHSSMEIENLNDFYAFNKINSNYNAINYIFKENINCFEHPMDFLNIIETIVSFVTNGEISKIRNTEATVINSSISRTKPFLIRNALYELIDNYNYMIKIAVSKEDFFNAVAYFHIKFLHIHPFEDGNGRTVRILLTYQLLQNNLAPALITKEDKAIYCDYIENFDYKGMSKLMQYLSNNELSAMKSLYLNLSEENEFVK